MENTRTTLQAERVASSPRHAQGAGPPLHALRLLASVRRTSVLYTEPGGITTSMHRYAVQKRMNGVQNPGRLANLYKMWRA